MVSVAALSLLLVAGFSAAEVYNTNPARIEDFPSVVQIEVGAGPIWVQVCAGAILTNRHVLTAAHCFYGLLASPRFRRVRAGTTYRGRDGELFGIERATNHPSFTGKGFDGDISLVRLNSYLTFSSAIQQVPIPGPGTVFPANVGLTFVGWGRTAQDVIWADRELNSVGLFTVPQSYCETQYGSLPVPVTITNNMICNGEPGALGTNIGIRDSGAPLFYNDVLVGVVAFGSPIGESYPLVATSVSAYSTWITEAAV